MQTLEQKDPLAITKEPAMGIHRSSSSNCTNAEIVLVALAEVMREIFIQQQLQDTSRADFEESDGTLTVEHSVTRLQ